jgi:CheY-like chemotaxis protein
MKGLLEKNGCRVSEAENGEIALAMMEKERPSLIFLDLMMPVMDGFEFTDRVRSHEDWRTIPIVAVTARELTSAERKRLNGYVEMILKKAGRTNEELLAQVRDALDNCAVGRVSLV